MCDGYCGEMMRIVQCGRDPLASEQRDPEKSGFEEEGRKDDVEGRGKGELNPRRDFGGNFA